MSYKYQNGGTPDHVNSDDSNSTAVQQHFSGSGGPIKIPAQKTDNTAVAMRSPALPQLTATRDSLVKDYRSTADRLSQDTDHPGSLSALEVLGMATDGDADARHMMRSAEVDQPKANAAVADASVRRAKYSK